MDKRSARADSASQQIPLLHMGLLRAQRRWWLRAMLRGSVSSTALGLVVFCALGAIDLLVKSGAIWRLRIPFPQALSDQLAASTIAFACSLLVALLLAILRGPDLAEFARAADRKFGLKERLSTALEVASAQPLQAAKDPILAALLADAERSAGSMDMRALVGLRLPRAAWGVPALLVAGLLLHAVPPITFTRAGPAVEISDTALDDRQLADATANLRRVADMLDHDATERSDAYLRTIARALERLSADVARGAMDRPRLAGELRQLLAHAQKAYAGRDRSTDDRSQQRHPTELLRSVLDEIAASHEAVAQATGDPAAPAMKAGIADRSPPGPPSSEQRRRAGGEQKPAEDIAAAVRRLAGADIPWLFLDEDGAAVDPRSQLERLVAEDERRARAAAQPSGAAANAGRGDGDQAGDGVQPIGRGETKTLELVATEQMLLPEPQSPEGRRVRIEIPPNAAPSEVAMPSSVVTEGWRPMQEQPVDHPALDAQDLKVVGRYFNRSTSGAEAGVQGPKP
jgi:hypothetical protein